MSRSCSEPSRTIRLAYALSVGLLAVLLGVTLGRALFQVGRYQETHQVQLQELPDRWVVSQRLLNKEQEEVVYLIRVAIDGQEVAENRVTLKPGGGLGYFYHVHPGQLKAGNVVLSLYKGEREQLVDRVAYFLSPLDLARQEKLPPSLPPAR